MGRVDQRHRDVLSGLGRTALALAATLSLAPEARAADAAGAPPAPAPRAGTLVVLLATVTPAGDAASPEPLARPVTATEPLLARRAHELDALLAEGVQDLGLTLDLSDHAGGVPSAPRDSDLLARAARGPTWVLSPRLELDGNAVVVRIVAVAPGSSTLTVRVERVTVPDLPTRAVVMLRDLVTSREGCAVVPDKGAEPRREASLAVPARSPGRATLAANGAVFGGFVGYSIQRSSGSDDPRLLYPLMALGTGVGLGASMIVSEEWDVGIGDAWYLSAAAWWPAASGLLLARGSDVTPESDRWAYGLAGAGAGVGLATFALSFGGMGEGGALLAHSAGAFGTVLGGLTEMAWRGSTDGATPARGMGWGAGAGVLAAGALATQVTTSASRIALIDLGAGLGGLAGAAAASPFLFGERTEGRERTFVLTTLGATVAGGAVAWGMTRTASASAHAGELGMPMAGVVGWSPAAQAPIYGFGWQGAW